MSVNKICPKTQSICQHACADTDVCPLRKICPKSQKECLLNCSDAGEFCFDMRRMCHEQLREGHKQFGKLMPFEDPPPEISRSPDDPNYVEKPSHIKKHAKLHGKVYFQGADKRKINPNPEQNEDAQRNQEELQLRHALRYGKNMKPPTPMP